MEGEWPPPVLLLCPASERTLSRAYDNSHPMESAWPPACFLKAGVFKDSHTHHLAGILCHTHTELHRKPSKLEVGEMALRLRALAANAEDPEFPSSHQ